MSNPGFKYWEALKWLINYLKSILDVKVYKSANEGVKLKGFTNAYYGDDKDNMKSTSFYVYSM